MSTSGLLGTLFVAVDTWGDFGIIHPTYKWDDEEKYHEENEAHKMEEEVEETVSEDLDTVADSLHWDAWTF